MVQDSVKCSSLSSENAYSNLIWACLVDAIHLGSLEGNLKLMTEALLSSTLQADLLVLQGHSGFPVGVIKVKKPGAVDPLVETRIFGELFDYMMFLKSSYNLTQIFGLLSCYSDWYVCSLDPESSSSKSLQCSCNMESFELFSQEEHGLDPSTTSSASSSSSFMEPNEHPRKQCTLSQT